MSGRSNESGRTTRRGVLAGAAALVAAGAVGAAAGPLVDPAERTENDATAPFDGAVQAGILSDRQAYVTLVAFDVVTPDPGDLRTVLTAWTTLIRTLSHRPRDVGPSASDDVPVDTGEADGLSPSGLSVTVGFGSSLFDDRYGLTSRVPSGLRRLGPLPGEDLDPAMSDGDLVVQVCANDRQVVFHAVHQLANAALGIARPRWTQHGFASTPADGGTPRNLFGFKDGTDNVVRSEPAALRRHLWVARERRAADWMTGGTYLVYRRIRMRMQAWDRETLAEQERSIGRRRFSGAPLGGRSEHDAVDLQARDASGALLTPVGSHVRAAHPETNGGVRIRRRGYNYDDGWTVEGEPDVGLVFVCFTSDPEHFARIQRRLTVDDDLQHYLTHTAGGVFAVPPAPANEGFLGAGFLA